MIQGYFKYWSIIVLMLVFVFQANATENSTPDIVGLMDKLKRTEPGYKIFVFHQISELGEAAQPAGAQIEKMVENDDELSSAAAETLGWIGYRPGIPTLIEAMNSRNWELVYQAIWSLGRLRATEARESLEQIRNTHWSHLVSMEAQKSLDVLDQPLPDFKHVDFGSSAERFNQLQQVMYWEPTCQNEVEWQGERLKLETNSVLPFSAKPEQLPEFIPQETGKEDRTVMKVRDGWLVGVSHGEFCSGVAKDYLDCGLHYFSANGTHTLIVQGNIDGIYQTANNGLVVTEGVDHMGYSPGHVFKLTQPDPSSWRTELLAITQASPRKMAMAADGTLILQTQGSVVAVTQGGELKAVTCMDNQ